MRLFVTKIWKYSIQIHHSAIVKVHGMTFAKEDLDRLYIFHIKRSIYFTDFIDVACLQYSCQVAEQIYFPSTWIIKIQKGNIIHNFKFYSI